MIIGLAPAERLRIEFQLRSEARAVERDKEKAADRLVTERKRDEEARQRDSASADAEIALVMASEIIEFQANLDRYDAATVEALQANGEALAAAKDRVDELLGEAHVLPDGRRVFTTRDGQRLFDKAGIEVTAELVDPDAIGEARPRWETFRDAADQLEALCEERERLFAYQQELDRVRARLDAGEISREEFEWLRNDLKGGMPICARASGSGCSRASRRSGGG